MKRILSLAAAALLFAVLFAIVFKILSPQTAAAEKLRLFDAVAGNDNDPRLDAGFNDLPAETKAAFRRRYGRTSRERRNERGTLVFLLGRNLSAPEDWAFLRAVVLEPPCLSRGDCAKAAPEDPHEPEVEIVLAYPQLVALKAAERALATAGAAGSLNSEAAREARSVIAAAKDAPAPLVATRAAEIQSGN